MEGIEQLFVQNVGAVSMAGGFIYYLVRKDKTNRETFKEFNDSLRLFNKTLNNHLQTRNKMDAETAKILQRLTDCIESFKNEKGRRKNEKLLSS